MIGQETVLEIIDKFNLDTLPHSLSIIGSSGSGKHTIVKYISEKMHLPCIDITEHINL